MRGRLDSEALRSLITFRPIMRHKISEEMCGRSSLCEPCVDKSCILLYRVATSIKIHYYVVCRVCIFWFLVGVAHYGMEEVWAAMLR